MAFINKKNCCLKHVNNINQSMNQNVQDGGKNTLRGKKKALSSFNKKKGEKKTLHAMSDCIPSFN